jgi:hypothetical protein
MNIIIEKMQEIFSLRAKAQEKFESINKTFCAIHGAESIW